MGRDAQREVDRTTRTTVMATVPRGWNGHLGKRRVHQAAANPALRIVRHVHEPTVREAQSGAAA